MSAPVSDELIMAFADGELDTRLASRVRDAIRRDDGLRSRHAMYRGTRSVLAEAFNGILHDPLPDRLRHAVARTETRKR